MIAIKLPKYVTFKHRKDGVTYFWTCPAVYRKAGAPFTSETLGRDLLQAELNERAAILNDRLAAWRNGRDPMREERDAKRHGTVEWLSEAYQKHDSFLERVSEFSRPDYRRVLRRICDLTIVSDSGLKVRVGDAKVNQIGVSTAEKIYKAFIADGAARSSEKVVTYCKAMWKRMLPHHPDIFNKTVGNPWEGVTVKRREKAVKGHVDRETVYLFAEGAIAEGRPELAAAAVLAFEFLMRPSSIGAGFCGWSGYRGKSDPDKIIVRHRKTGELAVHPLEYVDENGQTVILYPQAEAILKKVPKYGASLVCQKSGRLFGDGSRLSQDVREIADKLAKEGVAVAGFTLDKARHGGMTELEEKGLTEGQGRVLSKHRTATAYRGYAKETELRVLEATKKRMGG